MNKIIFGIFFIFSISSIFGISKENLFWNWFEQNQNKLFNFEQNQDKIFNELTLQLHKIDPNLTFEFGPINNNKRDFVISADGIRNTFPFVESLFKTKPVLSQWNIIKFRPRRDVFNQIKYNNLTVKPEDVYYIIERDNDKIGLNIFIKNYNKNDERFLACIFLFLDNSLGEYDTETKVGFIKYYPLETKTKIEKKLIKYLSKDFDLKYKEWVK